MSAFPHKVFAAQTTCGVTVEHTLEVLATLNDRFNYLLQEIDCRLHIEVGSDGGDMIWMVDAVTFERTHASDIYITAKDDPAIWELVRRSVMANFKRIDEEVYELAKEAA